MYSKNHANRAAHNWLVYDINDRFLEQHKEIIKGVLYDLGCGDSFYRDFFLRHAESYVGVDWESSFHEHKAHVIADLNKPLPIASDVADTIVSLAVLEHICEPQTMLDETLRLLKPGGHVILQVPWQWWIHEAPFDFFRYTPHGLEYLLRKSGFENITVKAQSGFFTTWITKANYFSRRFVRGPEPLRWIIRTVLSFFWFLGQISAPTLDRLDKRWDLEAIGYFVTAQKP